MSPRRKRIRKIFGPPAIKGLRPSRRGGGSVKNDPVVLLLEEYESIKLCDYDLLNHNEASQVMGVSRPTFTRIYSAARQKVAKSFVEVREIIVEGGKVYYDSEWFGCKICGCDFNYHDKSSEPKSCPLCGSDEVANIVNDDVDDNHTCLCSECGYSFDLVEGDDCAKLICPKCGHSICKRR